MADTAETFTYTPPTPSTAPSSLEPLGFRRTSRPRGRFLVLAAALVALLLGVGIGVGGAVMRTTLNKLDARVANAREAKQAVQRDLDFMSGRLEQSQTELADAHEDLRIIQNKLATAEKRAQAAARKRLRAARAKVAKTRRELKDRAATVAVRERKVAAAERRINRNSFTDGVWEVGVDIDPGVYRAQGGSRCYWGILGSANTRDIVNQGGFSENQTVTLREGRWFDTSTCGEWTKIG